MKIKTMSISDYADVYSLWLSCKGMGLNSLDDSRVGIEKFLIRNPDTCFVAEIDSLKKLGINKIALVVFDKNKNGNAFWEKQGFTERNDLIYRNKTINNFERIDT